MKSIIKKHLYVTDRASEIVWYDKGLGANDFLYIRETLYRSKKGNLFLHASGGAMTEYAESCAGGKSGSSVIIPMDTEDVLEWCGSRRIQNDNLLDLLSDSIDEA